MSDVTQILQKIASGEPQASEELLPLVYDELRKLAAARMVSERPDHTLQATALVHEAYVRLVDADPCKDWDSRGHFFAAAAEAMRRILVDYARQKGRQKRGGGLGKFNLDELDPEAVSDEELILHVHDALDELNSKDPIAAEFVKLRYFAGFSIAETAQALGLSAPTAYAHWAYAKAMMVRLMSD